MKLFCMAIVAVTAVGSFGDVIHWIGPDGGDWWDAANWSPATVPQSPGHLVRLTTDFHPGATIRVCDAEKLAIAGIDVPKGGKWTLLLEGTLKFSGTDIAYTNSNVDVCGGSELVFVGGSISNVSYKVVTDRGGGKNRIVFSNTVNEASSCYYRNGSDEDTPDAFTIAGGVHRFRTWYPRLYDRMTVASGFVAFGSIHGMDRFNEGKDVNRDDALWVSGGKVVLDGENEDMGGSSIGIRAFGRGIVDIKGGVNKIWIANFQKNGKKKTCTWRVEDKALFTAAGPYVVGNMAATGNVEVAGGRFVMTSTFQNTGAASDSVAGRSSTFLVDGGILDLDYASDGSLQGTVVKDAHFHRLVAGPDGAEIRNRNDVTLTITGNGFTSAPEGDGGVVYSGLGKIKVSAGAYTGGTLIRGYVQATSASGAFGSGPVKLDGGGFATDLAASVLPALSYTNSASISLTATAANLSVPSITGPADGGVLILRSGAYSSTFGTSADNRFVMCESAPVVDGLGLPVSPVVALTSASDNSASEMHLLVYDSETKKFKVPQYVDNLNCGQTRIACIKGDFTDNQDVRVGALVCRGAVLNGGKITIGNGSGNAYLVLLGHSNGKAQSSVTGGRSVDFGGARGYVLGGNNVGTVACGAINGYLNGSGGVVFCTASGGSIVLYRKQQYSGGTKVMGGLVDLLDGTTYQGDFGEGKVVVTGGEYTGGTVRFSAAGKVYAHDYEISGFGVTSNGVKVGALEFGKSAVLSGTVSIADDAMITALADATGTVSRVVAGIGDLYIGGEGTISTAGVDIDGDLHVTGELVTDGSLLTDGRFLYLDGRLVLCNTEDITVDAKVIGEGTLVLAGSGKVTVSDLSVFEGEIDLAGNSSARLNVLSGIASVVNSDGAKRACLTVVDAAQDGYFGEIGDMVDLTVAGGIRLGVGAVLPADASLALDGGAVWLGEDRVVAALSGNGSVTGAELTVTGAVNPVDSGSGAAALTFETYPVLSGTMHPKWRLKKTGRGAETVLRKGLAIIVR